MSPCGKGTKKNVVRNICRGHYRLVYIYKVIT